MDYIKIHRYIRSKPSVLNWDFDIFAAAAFLFWAASSLIDNTYLSLLAIGVTVYIMNKFQAFRDSKLKGLLQHLLYKYGFLDSKIKNFPKSHITEFIG